MRVLINTLKEKVPIPYYYKKYKNPDIDLEEQTSIPCEFHGGHDNEFTYSPKKKIWMCWGKCHTGGDVINLHKLNFKFKTREEAAEDLAKREHIVVDELSMEEPEQVVDEGRVEYLDYYHRAIALAKTVEDYLELDYIMSQHKFRNELIEDLADFVVARE